MSNSAKPDKGSLPARSACSGSLIHSTVTVIILPFTPATAATAAVSVSMRALSRAASRSTSELQCRGPQPGEWLPLEGSSGYA